MKRLLALCIALTLFACKKEAPKDYATLSGKIENHHASKILKIFQGNRYSKNIKLATDGTFKDTLKVIAGEYTFQHGDAYGVMFLENNNTSTLTTNLEDFANSMVFGGDASDTNNFLLQSFLISNDYFTEDLVTSGDQKDLDLAIKNYKEAYEAVKAKYADVDSTRVANIDRNIESTANQIEQFMASKIALRSQFAKGSPSPTFIDYENFAGGSKSLSDLKGKYVYMDIWATWCGPCIKEIPALKSVEKQFEGKNIEFVSISVDEGRGYKGDPKEAYKGWKKMITEKELGGIQLLADNGFNSEFIIAYQINGIPRFILIDPEGNIIDADAPRPSNPKLVELLNTF
ncbi:MAG: TlpA family protein disulfide reductase [Winogradskyella sp.]|nr:TlpA family protein disulfide reductase [Winogradskyella sp.]